MLEQVVKGERGDGDDTEEEAGIIEIGAFVVDARGGGGVIKDLVVGVEDDAVLGAEVKREFQGEAEGIRGAEMDGEGKEAADGGHRAAVASCEAGADIQRPGSGMVPFLYVERKVIGAGKFHSPDVAVVVEVTGHIIIIETAFVDKLGFGSEGEFEEVPFLTERSLIISFCNLMAETDTDCVILSSGEGMVEK